MNGILKFLYVTLAYVVMICIFAYYRNAAEIIEHWGDYRCNPSFWMYAENLSDDLAYCVKDYSTLSINSALEPVFYGINMIGEVAGGIGTSLDFSRFEIAGLTGSITNIFSSLFGGLGNLTIQLQIFTATLMDIFGKLIGIVKVFQYIVDTIGISYGSLIKTPEYKGITSMDFCFHPDTLIKLQDGTTISMKNLNLNDILEDGTVVFSIMKISNACKSPLYCIKNGTNNSNIYVTGSHDIWDKNSQKFIQVQHSSVSKIQNIIKTDELVSLITSSGKIPLGDHIFGDWEQDSIYEKPLNSKYGFKCRIS
jgi:hypothetical protein